jgi:CBS domain-containing protein
MTDQKQSNSELLSVVRFHPLFQGVEPEAAASLLSLCEEKTYASGEIILQANQARTGLVLVLNGIAEVFVKDAASERDEVLEVVQKGEILGFSSLADFLGVDKKTRDTKSETMVEVRAVEDVRALHVPFDVIAKRWGDPKLHDYLLTQVAIRIKDIYGSLAEQVKLARNFGEGDALVMRVQDMMSKSIISCSPDDPVQKVASLMIEHQISSIVVLENSKLKGIITERDIVERVVVQSKSFEEKAKSIMTPNPYTISRFSYYYDALSTFILNGVKHLPVVDDGHVSGILSLSDLLRKKNENMMKVIKKIEDADAESLSQVKKAIYEVLDTLLKEKVPILNTLEIITKLYDRLVIRAINIAINDLEKNEGLTPPVEFCFYQMGSAGRAEQFMLTDQDHFIVFEDCHDKEEAHAYFKKLGEKIVYYLELAGYARCKGLMMASEAKWRGTLLEWEDRVREWRIRSTNDNLLLAINFFSYRRVYGSEKLHKQFEQNLEKMMARSEIFLFRLAQIEHESPIPTLDQPIRSLFKLERKSIDMKKEILFPYHHGLQILSLLHGVLSGTPLERIEALEKKGVLSARFANDVRAAASQVLAMYVNHRWQQAKRGEKLTSVLEFVRLSTREKEELIISLKTLQEMQRKLFHHFPILTRF